MASALVFRYQFWLPMVAPSGSSMEYVSMPCLLLITGLTPDSRLNMLTPAISADRSNMTLALGMARPASQGISSARRASNVK